MRQQGGRGCTGPGGGAGVGPAADHRQQRAAWSDPHRHVGSSFPERRGRPRGGQFSGVVDELMLASARHLRTAYTSGRAATWLAKEATSAAAGSWRAPVPVRRRSRRSGPRLSILRPCTPSISGAGHSYAPGAWGLATGRGRSVGVAHRRRDVRIRMAPLSARPVMGVRPVPPQGVDRVGAGESLEWRVFHASSPKRTSCCAVSRLNGGSGGRVMTCAPRGRASRAVPSARSRVSSHRQAVVCVEAGGRRNPVRCVVPGPG